MRIADMHCDTISKLLSFQRQGKAQNLWNAQDCHVNLEKLRGSGYLLQNFALFVDLKQAADPLEEVLCLADLYWRELNNCRDFIAPVLYKSDLERNYRERKLSAVLTVEEGQVCRGNPAVLRTLFRLGVRMMTLTWNYPNCLAFPNGQSGGLSPIGEEIVEEMEHLGMIVDVSHLGDDGFWQIARIAQKPFVASHSCCRSLCYHPRNLTDDMMREIAEHGGVIGINFYSRFLGTAEESRTEDIVRHIRHAADIAGFDAVALGSDFDGIDCQLQMKDSSGIGELVQEMERNGFTQDQIEAICWKNVYRVYQELLPILHGSAMHE